MKRAQMFRLVSLILAIVAGFALLTQTKFFADMFKEENQLQTCRSSFVTASIGNLPTGKYADFECPRNEVKIQKADVSDRGGNVKPDLILERIAQLLLRCNYKTARGTADPYEKNALTSSTACLVCSDVTFGERLGDTGISDLDLLSYLERDVPGKDYTYLSRLKENRKYINYKKYGGIQNVSVQKEYYVMHILTHGGKMNLLSDAKSAIIFVSKDSYRAGCSFIAN